jgi:hypothetical protein
MKLMNIQTVLAMVACVGMACPPGLLAAPPAPCANDVALRPGGVLVGQVIDQQGAVKSGTAVAILSGDQEIARTTTDQNGIFAAQGLRGGNYQIVTGDGVRFCRLWAANTAPPAAPDAAIVVTGQEIVRGQWMPSFAPTWNPGWGTGWGSAWLNWVRSHPYITAGIVAAAIAAPVAVSASQDDGPNS